MSPTSHMAGRFLYDTGKWSCPASAPSLVVRTTCAAAAAAAPHATPPPPLAHSGTATMLRVLVCADALREALLPRFTALDCLCDENPRDQDQVRM